MTETKQPSAADLDVEREVFQERQKASLGQVNALVQTQHQISQELNDGIDALKRQGEDLDDLEGGDAGLMASLMRRFNRRKTILARRSMAEGLLQQYEVVSVRLRRATAFSDELRLCALELQSEVNQLHRDLQSATDEQLQTAARVIEIEEELAQLASDPLLPDQERARRLDALEFELRTESLSLQLYEARKNLCTHHLDPARALRDTVLHLHEEMAQFVLAATATVNGAGRKIQALGAAADAPTVIGELQSSLEELGGTMQATQAYIEETHDLLTRVLPELSARLHLESEQQSLALTDDLENISQDRTHALAQRALLEAAEAEIEEHLTKASKEQS